MRKTLLAAALLCSTSALAAPIDSNPLLSSGGNTFDSFTCSALASGSAGPGSCSEIDVSSTGGNLSLQSSWIATHDSSADTLLTFHVHSASGISAVGLSFMPIWLGFGVSAISEYIYSDAAMTNLVGRLGVNCFDGACGPSDVSDPPYEAGDIALGGVFSDLWIKKDISVDGFFIGDLAANSWIGQPFTSIPEPSSLAIFGASLLGFAALRKAMA